MNAVKMVATALLVIAVIILLLPIAMVVGIWAGVTAGYHQ